MCIWNFSDSFVDPYTFCVEMCAVDNGSDEWWKFKHRYIKYLFINLKKKLFFKNIKNFYLDFCIERCHSHSKTI